MLNLFQGWHFQIIFGEELGLENLGGGKMKLDLSVSPKTLTSALMRLVRRRVKSEVHFAM